MYKKLLAVLIVSALFPSVAFGAVSFDSATSSASGGGSGAVNIGSFNNVAGNYLVLTLFSNAADGVTTGITYGGVPLTKEGHADVWEFWTTDAPPTGANDFVITSSGSINHTISAATYSGAELDTNGGVQAHGGATSVTRTVSLSDTGYAVCAFGKTTTLTAGASNTLRTQGTGDSGGIVDRGPQAMGSATCQATMAAGDTKSFAFTLIDAAITPTSTPTTTDLSTDKTADVLFYGFIIMALWFGLMLFYFRNPSFLIR